MKNMGREWLPPGEETKVDVYDFGQKDPKKKGRIMQSRFVGDRLSVVGVRYCCNP